MRALRTARKALPRLSASDPPPLKLGFLESLDVSRGPRAQVPLRDGARSAWGERVVS